MKAEAQGSGLLAEILRDAAGRAAAARSRRAALERAAAAASAPPDFGAALAARGDVAVIGEIKRRSPSAGAIRAGGEVVTLARSLEAAGAGALSVLTEPAHFGGSLDDLAEIAAAVGVPVLRKDFILDPVQLYEARASGAAAVLLIVRILGPGPLAQLLALARDLKLAALVEVHGHAELDTALGAGATIVGVNARDLDTLNMDAGLVARLLPAVPSSCIAVAESGLGSRADVERVAARGADAVLVGTAVSGAAEPAAALRRLLGVARRPRSAVRS
jgi:indole-3-glycerol phosphate synthase